MLNFVITQSMLVQVRTCFFEDLETQLHTKKRHYAGYSGYRLNNLGDRGHALVVSRPPGDQHHVD